MPTATVTEGGISADVTVPDGLPPDVAAAQAHAAFQTALAQRDASTASQASPSPTAPDSSIMGSAAAGAAGPLSGLGTVAKGAGEGLTAVGLPTLGGYATTAGNALQGAAKAITPAGGEAPTDVIGKARSGDYGGAAYDFARGMAGSAAPLAVSAIPYVGLPALALGAEGQIAQERAQNNGRDAPTGGDFLKSVPGAAAQTAAYMIPGMGPELGLAGRVGMGALRGAGATAAEQVGSTAGTDKGLTVDPQAIAEGGAMGAAATGLHASLGIPGAVVKNIVSRGDQYQPVSEAHAQAMQDAGELSDVAAQQAKAANGRTDPLAVNNAAKTQAVNDITGFMSAMKKGNYIDSGDMSDMRDLLEQARRHNNTIGVGEGGAIDSILDQVKQNGAPADLMDPFVAKIRALDVLSTQSFANKQATPFQNIGSTIGGHLSSAAFGSAIGLPPVADLALGAMGVRGNPLAVPGRIVGGMIGKGADNLFGTNTPTLAFQRLAAARQYGGQLSSGNAGDLQAATNAASLRPNGGPDPVPGMSPDPDTGLPPTPMSQPAAQATGMSAGPQRPSLPPLQVNTPGDVRNAVAADGPQGPSAPPPVEPAVSLQSAPGTASVGLPDPIHPVAPPPPTDFSGTLNLRHGSQQPLTSFEQNYGGHRFDDGGNLFGNEAAYLDNSGAWTSPAGQLNRGFGVNHVYNVQAPFSKAFVLTPDNIGSLKSIVGPGAMDDGGAITAALRKKGYDGLILQGFDANRDALDAHYRSMAPDGSDVLRAGSAPDVEQAWWGRMAADNPMKGVMPPTVSAAVEHQLNKLGIPDALQQDQVVHFQPHRITMGGEVDPGSSYGPVIVNPEMAAVGLPQNAQGPSRPIWSPAHSYIANGAELNAAQIHAAADAAAAMPGGIDPAHVEALKAGTFDLDAKNPEHAGLAKAIQDQLSNNHTLDASNSPKAMAAAKGYQDYVAQQHAAALAEGQPALAAALSEVGAAHGPDKATTHAAKTAARNHHLASHPHHAARFSSRLMKHGPRK